MQTNYIPCPVRAKAITVLAGQLRTKTKNSVAFLEINDQLNKLYVEEIAAFEAFKRGEVVEAAMQ